MSRQSRRDFLKLAGAAMVTVTGVAKAADNPFAIKEMDGGYSQLADNHMEGKCGGNKPAKEGSCGGAKPANEGKCGGDKSKMKEGSCGGNKPAKEGKCGGDKMKEGKCGSNS